MRTIIFKSERILTLRYLEPKTGFLGNNFKSGEYKNNSRLLIYVSLLSEMNSLKPGEIKIQSLKWPLYGSETTKI